jgi:hypothetical protein
MTAESELGALLVELNQLASVPLAAPDATELADVALAAKQLRLAGGEMQAWADPLSDGQRGLDLLGVVMRRVAAQGGGRPLE